MFGTYKVNRHLAEPALLHPWAAQFMEDLQALALIEPGQDFLQEYMNFDHL